ncbi:MAG TPA: tRNA-intron lyase [Conexivisphaerales archaeon]|nr:tRNA-intron lyase [Conexivisphaerales archaeon]
MPKPALGELVENRIILWGDDEARSMYSSGYYGKPMGVAKPKGTDFNAPLILDLIEGYYLQRKRRLSISTKDGKLSRKGLRELCEREYNDFGDKYAVYEHLRDSGMVVTPGIKFGCDFAVYKHGPGIDHAPYLVQVMKPSHGLTATHVVLSGRLATTVRKQFLIATVRGGRVSFLAFDWWRA